MPTTKPIDIVQSMYGEFARGDVAALIARFHPEARLIVHAPDTIPYGGTRQGLGSVDSRDSQIG